MKANITYWKWAVLDDDNCIWTIRPSYESALNWVTQIGWKNKFERIVKITNLTYKRVIK